MSAAGHLIGYGAGIVDLVKVFGITLGYSIQVDDCHCNCRAVNCSWREHLIIVGAD
jgi:hypothetical protein